MAQTIYILKSKLLIPQNSHVVQREAVAKIRLNLSDKKAVVVSAGPGYGKTTFIAQAVSGNDVVWYRLGPVDSDLSLFLTYLIHGIQKYYSGFGSSILERLSSEGASAVEWDSLVSSFLYELEILVTKQLIIVLDDYHYIQHAAQLKHAVERILAYLPETCKLIFISRKPVDLSLSRFRASQEIIDISTRDLLLSKQEIKQLFVKIFDTPLTTDEISTLYEKTDGWISGLILFHHSLPARDSIAINKQLSALKGSSGIIFDYLDENIFNSTDDALKHFLLKTSLLSQLNADVCDQLMKSDGEAGNLQKTASKTAPKNAIDILDHLTKINLFTFCLDESNKDYCYHHLFQDFLKKKLEKHYQPEKIHQIHLRIATILEEKEDYEEAAWHYIKATDYVNASRVLSGLVRDFIKQSRLKLMKDYLSALPKAIVQSDPWMLVLKSTSCSLEGRFRESMHHLASAYALFEKSECEEGINKCLSDMGIRYYLDGNFIDAEVMFTKLLNRTATNPEVRLETIGHLIFTTAYLYKIDKSDELIAEANRSIDNIQDYAKKEEARSWIMTCCALRYWATGDLDLAFDAAQIAKYGIIKYNLYRLRPLYHQMMAMFYYHKGTFHKGLEEAEQGLAVIEEKGLKETAFGWLLCYAACNSICLGKKDDAYAYGNRCLKLFEYLESPWGIATAYNFLQTIYLVDGDFEASETMGKKALKIAEDVSFPIIIGAIYACLADVYVEKERFEEASESLKKAEDCLSMSKVFYCYVAQINAHLAHKTEGTETAIEKVNFYLSWVEKSGLGNWMIGNKKWLIPYLVHCYAENRYKIQVQEIIDYMGEKAVQPLTLYQKDNNSHITMAASAILNKMPKRFPPDLTIQCFGPFRVFRGDVEILPAAWKSKKAKTVLKLLIHYHSKGFVSKEVFIEHLWPDDDPSKTAKRFHVALAAIRKTLEPDIERGKPSSYIQSDTDRYRLYLGENGRVDVREFEALYQQSKKEESLPHKVDKLTMAASLYLGDYFAEDLYDDWCSEDRESLKMNYLNSLSEMIRYYESVGNITKAIDYCFRYLKIDVAAESVYQQLMRFYAVSKNVDMVRTIYKRCQKALSDALDCTVSSETEQLFKSLIHSPSSLECNDGEWVNS